MLMRALLTDVQDNEGKKVLFTLYLGSERVAVKHLRFSGGVRDASEVFCLDPCERR